MSKDPVSKQEPKLKKNEITYAQTIVREQHPLYRSKIEQVFPPLTLFARLFRKKGEAKTSTDLSAVANNAGDNQDLRRNDELQEDSGEIKPVVTNDRTLKNIKALQKSGAVRNKEAKKAQKNAALSVLRKRSNSQDSEAKAVPHSDFWSDPLDLNEDETVLDRLGYGLVSYFSLIKMFFKLFLFLSLANVPLMLGYGQFDAFADSKMGFITKYTIGNMGQAETKCGTFKRAANNMFLECSAGVISNVTYYGVYADDSDADHQQICRSDLKLDTGDHCGYLSEKGYPLEQRMSQCVGTAHCILNDLDSIVPLGKQKAPHADCEIKRSSSVYVQYQCKVTDADQINQKRKIAALAGALAIFSSLTLVATLYHQKRKVEIEKISYDLRTVVASDYTLRIDLNDDEVENLFKHQVRAGKRRQDDPMGLRAKIVVIDKIEQICDSLVNAGKKGGKSLDYKVADLNFVYKNSEVIRKLQERGDAIKRNDGSTQKKTQRELRNYIFAHKDRLQQPGAVFVTFETEIGYNAFKTLSKVKLFTGQELEVTQAIEPTNIIWENQEVPQRDRARRIVISTIIVLILLALTFALTFYIKKQAKEAFSKYDKSMNCEDIHDLYKDEALTHLATNEWRDYYVEGGEAAGRQISGILDCFCNQQFGKYYSDVYSKTWKDEHGREEPICEVWLEDFVTVKGATNMISGLIVGINFFFKTVLIKLVNWIRLPTQTHVAEAVLYGVFMAQFFNTGFMLVLNEACFADFDGGEGLLSSIFVVGQSTDFTMQWYNTIGLTLMKTMMISAVFPIGEFCGFWCLKYFMQLKDRSFTADEYHTKKESVQMYAELYTGPEYLVHFRYSNILLHVGIAFMYGTAMPLLYPIACLAFLVLFINERLLICYYYRMPPAFSEQITQKTISIAKYAILLSMPLTFWQLGNRQIFDNVLFDISSSRDIRLSGHTIESALDATTEDITWNTAPLIMFVIFAILLFVNALRNAATTEDDPLENLAPYQQAIEDDDKEHIEELEKHYIEKWGIKTWSETQFDRLINAKTTDDHDKLIMNVPSYRILSNIQYLQDFQFAPPEPNQGEVSDRAKQQSDFTYACLNLPFIKEEEWENYLHEVDETEESIL